MKILFFVSFYPDEYGCQAGIFIHNQAKALLKLGHDVSVLFVDYRSIRKKRRLGYSTYVLEGIKVYRMAVPIGPVYRLIDVISRGISLQVYKRVEKETGIPDIVYCHNGLTAWEFRGIIRNQTIRYAIIEHSSLVLTENVNEKERRNLKTVYEGASVLIAVSNALKKKMENYTDKDIQVVPNIIPEYMFIQSGSRKNTEEFCFISVANLIKSKGFDLLIDAYSSVVRNSKKSKLIIIGAGPEKTNLEKMVYEREISEYVEFKGEIANKDLPLILNQADCFVLPSRFETFGVVYIEAMACGLPVIATKCGGPEDFVDITDGILISVDDSEALSEAMTEMIVNRNHFVDNIQLSEKVYNTYSENVVGKRLIDIFSNVLGNNK